MTKNLDDRKYKIIQELINIDDELLISEFEARLAQANKRDVGLWDKVIKPMRKTMSIEELVKEQDYIPLEKESFFNLTEELGIEESIDELLAQL